MAKVRVTDLAKQMGVSDKDLLFKLQSLGVQVESPASALDPEVIMAILSGKKLQARPRNVIMREDKPQPEKKTVVVKPPRPIVKPVKREEASAPEPAASSSPAPIIPEFIEAAEAEEKEQKEAAAAPKPAPRTRKAPAAAEAKTEASAVATVPEAKEPESPRAEEAPAAAAAASAHREESHHAPAPARPHAPSAPATPAQRRPSGPTGPRARMMNAPRPRYEAQPQFRETPARPAGAPAGARPDGGRPMSRPDGARDFRGARPAGPGAPAARPGAPRPAGAGMRPGAPGARPSGPGMRGPMAPPPSMPGAGPSRRKKADEEERPEKKKTTGKRGKRAPNVTDENAFFTKGPFSATEVLDDDFVPEVAPTSGEETTETRRTHTPSSRRDSRKQVAPVTGKVLDFKRPTGTVALTEGVTVKELADKLGVKANDLMKHLLMKKGMMLSINAPLGAELALEIAKDLQIDAEIVSFETALEIESLERATEQGTAGTSSRGPVITVMGHVDHGKTSLLDAIRETNVAAGEAGGITQHIGAYSVQKRDRKIVFLDTPGHEAFTMMRARGAQATDIVVLVVAADDGVMPQTKEAIDHSRAAKVPIIVAINKIDKPNANVDRVRRELADTGVLVEQWGGDVVSVEVSALKKQGIDDLLDMIVLTADMLDLKANNDMPSRGVILEARKDVGRGIVATVLVQDGTLKIGDAFISGTATGRVRAMNDDRGDRIKEAGPATPVAVMGFDDMPNAGDTFMAVDEEARARMISEMRQERMREEQMRRGSKMSLEQLFERMQTGSQKELNLIVKADVQGSVEVLNDTLNKLSTSEVKVNVLHSSVGAISTNDVLLASASDAIIVGFNVRPERNATELADKEGVEIRTYTVIYTLTDDIRQAMTGLLEPTSAEVFQGRAEVRETFRVPKVGTIAGCMVTEGIIPRTANIRLLRDNRVILDGKLQSLRHFKNDVSEVRAGFECGIGIERFQDIKIGDVIEAYKIEKTAGVLQ